MVVGVLARLALAQVCFCSVFLGQPLFAQQPSSELPLSPVGATEPINRNEISSLVDLDIYLQGPDSVRVEEPAALILVTREGQTYRQGTTRNGHLRWSEVAPLQYGIHIVTAGFEPAVQEIDAHGKDEFKVIVQLRPRVPGDKAYPAVSTDPEVNYVFGVYASKLGDWNKAKTYWTKTLELLPDHVPAMVSMSEALLIENKTTEAREYLDRATEADPSYWRAQAILADVTFRTGSPAEAVEHAQRAIALGHEEAASVSPLLARALVAEATEVLGAYVKDHPADVAAKKQLEGLSPPAELHGVEPLNAFGERNAATVLAKPAPRVSESRWLPPEVDESVPPVEPGSACNLGEVLQRAGQRIQEFVKNVERFTATESLVHETINKSGNVSGTEKRQYNYVVSIEEIRPELFNVEEYRSGSSPDDPPGGVVTKGLPALVLIFHPYYAGSFSMKCEGLANWNGQRAWQIYFRQRADKPNKIRSYKIGINGPSYPVALKGRAWFLVDTFQIVGMQTDLIDSLPNIRLTVDHATVEYGPVHFSSRRVDMWLPQTVELYSDSRGKRIHRRLTFTNYLLFAVDDKERISAPKTDP
jgi:tetratricopeptide (TPR) repeat protein